MTDAALRIVGAIVLVALFIGFFIGRWQSSDDTPTGDIGTAMQITRELHCAEDEGVIVSIGTNGLPYGWCKQVIER